MRPAEIEHSEGSHRWDNEAQGIGDSILQRWFNVERITRVPVQRMVPVGYGNSVSSRNSEAKGRKEKRERRKMKLFVHEAPSAQDIHANHELYS